MDAFEMGRIHPTALIDKGARLGADVTIGAYTIVYDGVSIGDGAVVGPHCILGEPTAEYYDTGSYVNAPLTIGSGALIRSHSCLYAGSEIGSNFQCGHRVTIREKTSIGDHGRVGTLSDIQGDCELGNYVSLHSNVHIGQKSKIGNFVWIFPYTVLTNDPQPPSDQLLGVTVEDFAVIATMVVVLPGVTIGRDALVGASAVVSGNVASEAVVVGNPSRQVATIHDLKRRASDGGPAYPWRRHYDKRMPWSGVGYTEWSARQMGAGGV